MPSMVHRPSSVPERLSLAGLALVPVAAVYPALTTAVGASPACPLRAVTGVPCPFCGGTTAAVALADGRLVDALAANPLVPLLVVAALVMGIVLAVRMSGGLPPPRAWSAPGRLTATAAVIVTLAASWVFQLGRTGWL